jgi:hypothetical protein
MVASRNGLVPKHKELLLSPGERRFLSHIQREREQESERDADMWITMHKGVHKLWYKHTHAHARSIS